MFAVNQYDGPSSSYNPLLAASQDDLGCRKGPAPATRSGNLYTSTPRRANPPSNTNTSTSMSFRYYQPPKSKRPASESETESSEEEQRRPSRRTSSASASQKRGACAHCKSLKVRCHFAPGQTVCQRCTTNKLQCTVIGRKKRRAVASHEELLLKSHRQDAQIAELLRQFDELAVETKIRSWMEKGRPKASHTGLTPDPSSLSPSSGSSHFDRDGFGWTNSYAQGTQGSPSWSSMANVKPSTIPQLQPYVPDRLSTHELMMYFRDESATLHSKPPEVVARKVIHPTEVHDLFIIYFRLINPFFSLLDPILHTPERLFWKSSFLFTAICAVAARYSEAHEDRLPVLAEFARDLAGQALVNGRKTIEECQAFLILSVYQLPRKHFDEQIHWLCMGLAFTIALELRLNDPPRRDELAAFESQDSDLAHRHYMNRIRTWLNCYCVDASHATQFGKPAMLDVDDYVASTCRNWYLMPRNLSIDVHLVAYVELLKLVRCFRIEVGRIEAEEKQPHTAAKVPEVLDVVWKYHDRILELYEFWTKRFAEHPQAYDYMCEYRSDNHRMINAFNRLVLLVYGLQRVISANGNEAGAGARRDDILVRKCIETAKEVIMGMTRKLHPTGMLAYAMEANFLFVTFAAAHLLSLQRLKMSVLLRSEDVFEIDFHVRELVEVLKAQEPQHVSKDARGRHAPFRYARYLSRQLKSFAAQLPSNTHHDKNPERASAHVPSQLHAQEMMHASQADNYAATFGTQTPRYSEHAPATDFVGYHGDSPVLNIPPANYGPYCPETAVSSSSAASMWDFQADSSNTLSGVPVDYSLLSFAQTVNGDSRLFKESPPPGSPEVNQAWWQHMYPVSLAYAPDGMDWPMTAGDGRRLGAIPEQGYSSLRDDHGGT